MSANAVSLLSFLLFFLSHLVVTAQVTDYAPSIFYNSHNVLNGKGELATSGQFQSGGSLKNEISIKTGGDLNQLGRAHRYLVNLPSPFTSYRVIDFNDDGTVLISLWNVSGGIISQYGTAVFKDETLTRLDASSASTSANELDEKGRVVGTRASAGSGGTRGVATPVVIDAGGNVTVIPHVNGGEYGYSEDAPVPPQVNPYVTKENGGVAAAINERGEVVVNYYDAGPEGYRIQFGRSGRRSYPAVYNVDSGSFTRIPALMPDVSGNSFYASDINDEGEIVGTVLPNGSTWLYLPRANYNLSGGYHFIRSRENNGSTVPAINNEGLITWPSYQLEPYSLSVWDQGRLFKPTDLGVANGDFAITSVIAANSLNQLLVSTTETGGSFQGFRGSRILTPNGGVSLKFKLPKTPLFEKDVPIEVTLEVHSLRPETVSISFPEGLLQIPDPKLCLLSEETVEPFQLSPTDRKRVYQFYITPKDYGGFLLNSKIEVISDEGVELISASEEILVNPLKITVEAKPLKEGKPIVNLKRTAEGNITDDDDRPVVPKVRVLIENRADKSVTARLQGLTPRARDKTGNNGRMRVTGTFPSDLGTIPAKGSVEREFALQIADDGRFDFQALITATIAGTATQFNTTKRGAPLAVNDRYPVEIELEFVRTPQITNQNNGAFFLQPGSSLKIIATVNNLTTNSTLEFYGIRSRRSLNAFGGTLTTLEGATTDPPFAYVHEIQKNKGLVMSGDIITDAQGAPSGTMEWNFLEGATLTDDADETVTEVTDDDVLFTTKPGDWLNDERVVRVIQDYSRPPRTEIGTLGEAAYYSRGVLIGMRNWTFDGLASVGAAGAIPIRIARDPSLLADAMGEASVAVWQMAELASKTWDHMTPAEREAFIERTAREVLRRAYLLGTTRSPIDISNAQVAFQNALEYTRGATYGLFGDVEIAYASDDPSKIADVLGRISGHLVMEVVAAKIPTPEFTEFTKLADSATLARNRSLSQSLNAQDAFLRTVAAGAVDEAVTIKHWGIGGKNLSDIKEVFTAFGVKGYMRERSPKAFQLIDVLKEAIWKPEAMKPKGIIDLDLLLLGDNSDLVRVVGKQPGGAELELDGLTAIFMPEDNAAIRRRLIGREPQEVIRAVEARAQLRREEFEKFKPEFDKWKAAANQGGGIPIGKNYLDNGVPNPGGQEGLTRKFDFKEIARDGQPTILIPQMADEAGVLKYISGDIDWVHFSFLDGSPLDSATAYRLYETLSRCCGLQHPETISWIKKGQTLFKGKIEQLREYLMIPGQKALLEVSGDGTRAVRMSPNLTRISIDGRNHHVFFDGGLKSRAKATLFDIESAFAKFQKKYPDRRLITPFLWLAKPGEEGGGSNLGALDWSFNTTEPAAVLARASEDGGVQRLQASGLWVDWDLTQVTAKVALTPTTETTQVIARGSTSLPLLDLPALWGSRISAHVDNWFAIGQTVVIAPGKATQEIATVLSINPLVLSTPLRFDHPASTLVAVLPASLDLLLDSDGDGSTDVQEQLLGTNPFDANSYFKVQSIALEEDSLLRLTWPVISDGVYTVDYSDSLEEGNWIPFETMTSELEGSMDLLLDIEGAAAKRFFRIRFGE